MKLYPLALILLALFVFSCGGSKKTVLSEDSPEISTAPAVTEIPKEKPVEKPIVEVEEKLAPIDNVIPDPDSYFVIIGSFRNPVNARNYQKQIEKDGFSSSLLRNESGLYRVSVMSSNDILVARKEIKRIREKFAKYSDTWLLIQVK